MVPPLPCCSTACRAFPIKFISTCWSCPASPCIRGRLGSRSSSTWIFSARRLKRCSSIVRDTTLFSATLAPPGCVQNGARRSLQQSRHGPQQVNLFPHTAIAVARHRPPVLREVLGIDGLPGQVGDQ